MKVPEDVHEQLVLLNRLVSRSSTRAREEYDPPTHGLSELVDILDARRKKLWAVEFFGSEDDADEAKRLRAGRGHNFIRLRQIRRESGESCAYVIFLFEHVDQSVRSFPVVHTETFKGRELSGDDQERGATAAHVVVRVPAGGDYQDGTYRCAIEHMPHVTRSAMERFFLRQLARHTDWEFTVTVQRRRKPLTKIYKYQPRLEFHGDVGRKLQYAITGGRILSHMIFTKRSERQSIGQPTDVDHEEIIADVNIKISGKQGPDDPQERTTWGQKIKDWYESRGFDAQLVFRSVQTGATISGQVHDAVSSAADLLMCPKEVISLSKASKRWRATIDSETVEKMKALLNKDALWERAG